MILKDLNINKDWTLFLDRDGVINTRIIGDYVKNWGEFDFLPGSIEAIVKASSIFGRIVVVTNQQGISKGLYTAEDLLFVHNEMIKEVENAGGKIDAVYYAPALASENSDLRKPAIGMALQAKAAFNEINFEKSIMVGDSLSDMEFGNKLNMITVFVADDDVKPIEPKVDILVKSLHEFVAQL
jgi:histidinol-phosphate phosphatase family protein